MTKPGMLSRPTDLDALRRAMALRMSESEIGDKDRDPKDGDEREGKTPGG
jgi:hypothetical protein